MNKTDALTRLTSLENEAKELRKIIEMPDQPEEISAKDWLLNFLSQDFTTQFTKGYVTHYIGDQWVFQQDLKRNTLWCYYYKIWEIFYTKYSMNEDQVQQLMKDVVLELLNCKGFTPDKK
jgi:hypothetical protein